MRQGSDLEDRCQQWLPKKQRFCANARFNGSHFCGNHSQRSETEWIQCPLDPSHSVIQENIQWHIKRCPFLKQFESLICQPFYKKGINCVRNVEDKYEDKPHNGLPGAIPVQASMDHVNSSLKRTAVHCMTLNEFSSLINRIITVHNCMCKDIRDSYRLPELCRIWIESEFNRKLPFQEKHVRQQASILGNLEDFGVLREPCVAEGTRESGVGRSCGRSNSTPAVVELGAGRGYLTQMLADCYGIDHVYLVDRKAYKLKADRSLRQKRRLKLERLRIDIEDLNLNGVESLHGVPYLAVGKHLCGSATDLALRCCLVNHGEEFSARPILRGLAITTCCHHQCQWKHYINKRYIADMGLTEKEFDAITWLTSWAVDAKHDAVLPDISTCSLDISSLEDGHVNGMEELAQSMKAVERATLGFMCKQIIDMGRAMWIKEHGFEAELLKYVPHTISPENHLLIASRTAHPSHAAAFEGSQDRM